MTMGASIRPGDAVTPANREGPLDQALGIHTDAYRTSLAVVQSVKDPDDLMRRAPAVGNVNFGEEIEGESIRSVLAHRPDLTENVYVSPEHDGFTSFANATEDDFAIQDAEWLDQPDALIWKSALLAQFKAKQSALAHFATDPASVQFGEELTEEVREALVQRARQLAEELRAEALSEIEQEVLKGRDEADSLSRKTAAMLRSLATTDERSGDLSLRDVDKLFGQGG